MHKTVIFIKCIFCINYVKQILTYINNLCRVKNKKKIIAMMMIIQVK